jgi:metal-responsive CopG/Arc/MetJ family transcriptional regulator
MNTETIRLNITIPKHLSQALNQVAGPRRRSQFIVEAIIQRLEQQEREALEKLLEEGYKAASKENSDITKEFEVADLEGWDDY